MLNAPAEIFSKAAKREENGEKYTLIVHKFIMGIEAYKPGVKNLLSKKIYVHYGDALEILEEISKDTISQIYMLFPDP